ADQIIIASKGSRMLEETSQKREKQVVEVLRQRLELELRASERCLESAVKFDDQYSKLLLRMIAADSMRHADVVSQIISWTELPNEPIMKVPKREFLDAILQIEDKASEQSLKDTVKISHPVARLLLEWIACWLVRLHLGQGHLESPDEGKTQPSGVAASLSVFSDLRSAAKRQT